MNETTREFLKIVSDIQGNELETAAFNIREDSQCAGRQSTPNIKIDSKEDGPGLVIHISKNAQKETVYIPACVTHGDVDDLVYNDFYVEAGADVIICLLYTSTGMSVQYEYLNREGLFRTDMLHLPES